MTMFLLYLLALRFALGYGDFMCMYIETLRCYMPITKEKYPGYCTLYESVLSCLQEQAVRCHVDNSTDVQDMLRMISDVCTEGTEHNTEYKKYDACYSAALKAEATTRCLNDFRTATVREIQSLRGAYLQQFKNSDDAKAKPSYVQSILQCGKNTLKDTCGDEAAKFFQKVRSPKDHFMLLACANEDDDYNTEAAPTKAANRRNYYKAEAPIFPSSWLLDLAMAWVVLRFSKP
ncbi:hypothetical protein JTE90_014566 [Oedothorax gibbosus]|uniref:Secreted protein n=1 Tax=Oedothorax gibbosus TaxID=931172 RepID=A0AAV6UC99_9ARAC|nr:hypothetical protein JTE90_014566 [Oedothorax gibbosus]